MKPSELHRLRKQTMSIPEGNNFQNGLGCNDDGGDDFDTSGLIESLAATATSAYETSQALGANPLNTALIYGGTAQTQQGIVGSAVPASLTSGSTGLLLLLLAGGFIAFALFRRRN